MANEELQRRSRRVRVFWMAAAAVAVAAVVVSMLPDSVEADVARVDRGDVRVEVVDEGRTRMDEIYVISAPVTGRVLRVTVEPGDEVAAGTVVARMSQAAAGFLDPLVQTLNTPPQAAGPLASEANLLLEKGLGIRRSLCSLRSRRRASSGKVPWASSEVLIFQVGRRRSFSLVL